MSASPVVPDVRTRARDALRTELADAALDTILQRGFDEVTVGELAEAMGISRATFFRYFASKDDVVVSMVAATDAELGTTLPALPSVDVTPWVLLRQIFEPAAVLAERAPDGLRARLDLIGRTPALQARLAAHREHRATELTELLTDRLGDEFAARIFAVSGLAALHECWQRWAADRQIPFRIVLDAAFDRLAGVTDPLTTALTQENSHDR